MSATSVRSYRHSDFRSLCKLVSENAALRWPEPTYLLNSDVAWRLANAANPKIALWFDQDELVAFAWFSMRSPAIFYFRGTPTPSFRSEVIGWLENKRRQFEPSTFWLLGVESMKDWEDRVSGRTSNPKPSTKQLAVGVLDSDTDRSGRLSSIGYDPTDHSELILVRDLNSELPDVTLPDNWKIIDNLQSKIASRVNDRQHDWSYAMDNRYEYLAILSPGGEEVGYCIVWSDPSSGIGSFEPVETSMNWRRMGFARKLNYEGLRRLKERGIQIARIATPSFNEPAASLYKSCGFTVHDRCRAYVKRL